MALNTSIYSILFRIKVSHIFPMNFSFQKCIAWHWTFLSYGRFASNVSPPRVLSKITGKSSKRPLRINWYLQYFNEFYKSEHVFFFITHVWLIWCIVLPWALLRKKAFWYIKFAISWVFYKEYIRGSRLVLIHQNPAYYK